MATEAKLRQLADKGCPVYYFYSTERYLVRQAVNAAVRVLSADSDEDATVLDGAAPEIEGLIMAAGTISFFGTRRVVVLPEVDPGAYGAKDLDELCSTLASLENAVVVLGSVFPLERSKLKAGKSAQKLIAQCKAIGYVEELAKPRPFELKAMMIDRAKAQGTSLPDGAAAALLERCGEDPFLLENEVDKLCALSGYQTVTAAMVADMGTVSLEADAVSYTHLLPDHRTDGLKKKKAVCRGSGALPFLCGCGEETGGISKNNSNFLVNLPLDSSAYSCYFKTGKVWRHRSGAPAERRMLYEDAQNRGSAAHCRLCSVAAVPGRMGCECQQRG